MQQLRPGTYPLNELYFIESDGVRFEGKDLSAIVNAVWGYRRRAGLPAGDPFAEVQAQICSRTPGDCQGVEELDRQPVPDDKELVGKVTARAADWLNERSQKKLRFINRAEQDARVEKCSHCPLNVEYKCGPCKKNIAEVLSAVVAPQIPHERLNAHACRLSGEDLSVGVMLDKQTFLDESPSHCWRHAFDL